ncbi:hypothetical protein DNTS_026215, partial [Danionella cerebrum]
GSGRTLVQTHSSPLLLSSHTQSSVSLRLKAGVFADAGSGVAVLRDELMMVLADVAAIRVQTRLLDTAEGAIRLSLVSLGAGDTHSGFSKISADVEQCECPWGYSGTSCECECNDHASECDINGECLGCTDNTSGPHCDQCLPGFYGDATEGLPSDCQRCSCPLTLETNNPTCQLQAPGEFICDQCEQGYSGDKCQRCAEGYFGSPWVPGGICSSCLCNGNVDRAEPGHCNTLTGECIKCLGNTTGWHCERCQDGFYGDAIFEKNCQACGCFMNGSLSPVCDVSTGQCECKHNVVGQTCDRCLDGYFGVSSDGDCRLCQCNQSGSISKSCDDKGQCQCIVGVTGDKCDRCHSGYYNYKENGCTHRGVYLSSEYTRGQPCECSPQGSNSRQCDLISGQCPCRPQFSGLRCERCALGFRNFPQCTPCNCNINGTRAEFCDPTQGVCSCSDNGVCSCKENVVGRGCDECKSGTFGLSAENPRGCSSCFCSGVSEECEELGGLIRVPLRVGSSSSPLRVVSQSDLQGTLEGVAHSSEETLLDAAHLSSQGVLSGPYYWKLPNSYYGNQLLSYGGRLSYCIFFSALSGIGLANQEPQVLMRGGALRRLVIYTDAVAPMNEARSTQHIPLTEHKWKYFNSVSDEAVSHSDFLSVLSNLEYIIIKASYGSGLKQSRISNISMETALDADDAPVGGEAAELVETCVCPPGYAGLSCQECSPGFFRQPVSELQMRGRNRPLVRPCVACRCHNHSQSCDLDTGDCLGCQHNTAGEHCHICASGYFGKVQGSVRDCSLFSSTCVSEGSGDFRCDRCEEGYEGRYCERCSVGYHGNPSEPGGRCQRCQCSSMGSLHAVCDGLTGRCECKPGVRGHLCDQCQERHVLEHEECVSCDDPCTGVLLDDLDALDVSIVSLNLTGVVLAPYKQLSSLQNQTTEIQLNTEEEHLKSAANQISALQLQTQRVLQSSEDVLLVSEERLTRGKQLLVLINNIHSAINGLVDQMNSVNATEEKQLDEKNRTVLLREMNQTLEKMRSINLTVSSTRALNELHSAEFLLNQVQDELSNTHRLNLLWNNISTTLDHYDQQLLHLQKALNTSRTHNGQSKRLLEDIQSNTYDLATLEELRSDLESCSPSLRKHVDALVLDLTKRDALHLVYRAEDHAQDLLKQAHALNSSLSDVRSSAVNVTSVSQNNLRDTIKLAEDLARAVNHSTSFRLNMTEDGKALLQKSLDVLDSTKSLQNRTQGLRFNVSEGTTRMNMVQANVLNFTRILPEALGIMGNLPKGSKLEILEVKQQTERANASLQEALKRLEDYRLKLDKSSTAVNATKNSSSSTSEIILDSEDSAKAASSKLSEAHLKVERLFERLKPLQVLGENLSRNLSQIKELISQARKQAASIKVAVAADGGCVRAYKPEVKSSNFNTLTLSMKTIHPDNLLFYMGSSTSEDFMALEMLEGKVSFLWDTGSGHTRLEYPNVQINNDKWHRINVTRFGRHATLSIQQMDSDPLPAVKATASGSSAVMDVNKSTWLFVGGLGGQVKKPSAVKVTHFKGCMGEASLNENNIGLPRTEETSFHFDGSGFSVVEKSLRSMSTSIVMFFKTLSPNGLLLYLASNGTRDFLSIELVEGKVRLTFELGSGALTLTSNRTYNTGVWYRIALQRNKRK